MPISLEEMLKLDRTEIVPEPPEDSVLNQLLPVVKEPSIVIYGPTKGGKTRLSAFEATALATKVNRRVSFILTESNLEQEDIRDILSACIYHNVYCILQRFDHLRGLSVFTSKLDRTIMKAIKKEDESELELIPRVFVIDSITSLANLVLEGLPENILDAGAPTTLPYVYPRITKVINPLRRLMSADYLNGYLIMTAHETQLRGEYYAPGTNIKSKPKYSGAAQYNDDTEIYLGATRDLPDSLKTCNAVKDNPSKFRPIIVATSRRHPDRIGQGVAVTFIRYGEEEITISRRSGKTTYGSRTPFVGRGLITSRRDVGGVVYEYIPIDMMGDESEAREIEVKPLIPVVGCGPKYVR